MDSETFKRRTMLLGLQIIRMVESLPRSRTNDVLGKQLVRCGTSVGANYRAACRAKSRPDFAAKMCIVEEEGDECLYWLDMLVQSGALKEAQVADLRKEANEIVCMVVASIKTARMNERRAR